MIVCDICKKPTRYSTIKIDSILTKENFEGFKNCENPNISLERNFVLDICPRCINKILLTNGLTPLYYEEKGENDANG